MLGSGATDPGVPGAVDTGRGMASAGRDVRLARRASSKLRSVLAASRRAFTSSLVKLIDPPGVLAPSDTGVGSRLADETRPGFD